ncbi:NRS/ER [Symbiodinium microadriaticum]|nr:NRS/ER [Symbiodinium microadriaticum]
MAASTSQPDFVLLGATGFLGASILRKLESKHVVCTSRLRLKDRLGLEALLDEQKPKLGVICAAGERGRPNIAWCDAHPVETLDANITGQLSVAAACHERGLHLILLGTGALYLASEKKRKFSEADPPNGGSPGVYTALRQKMEELTAYFNNVLVLRVLYPLSSDLDPRGLLGKLARFKQVDSVQTSVTILDDLMPLLPILAERRTVGVLNFTNPGTISYPDIVLGLQDRAAKCGVQWKAPEIRGAGAKAAAELDTTRLQEAVGMPLATAADSSQRIISSLSDEEVVSFVHSLR